MIKNEEKIDEFPTLKVNLLFSERSLTDLIEKHTIQLPSRVSLSELKEMKVEDMEIRYMYPDLHPVVEKSQEETDRFASLADELNKLNESVKLSERNLDKLRLSEESIKEKYNLTSIIEEKVKGMEIEDMDILHMYPDIRLVVENSQEEIDFFAGLVEELDDLIENVKLSERNLDKLRLSRELINGDYNLAMAMEKDKSSNLDKLRLSKELVNNDYNLMMAMEKDKINDLEQERMEIIKKMWN